MIGTEEAESRMSIENGGSGGIIINTASVAGLLPASVPGKVSKLTYFFYISC